MPADHARFSGSLIDVKQSDRLVLAYEPEGACLSVLNENAALQAGDSFLVLDCGGGTVDVTVHKLEQVEPLRMTEKYPPSGGDWGSTYVDAKFQDFLREFFGEDQYDSLKSSIAYINLMVRARCQHGGCGSATATLAGSSCGACGRIRGRT